MKCHLMLSVLLLVSLSHSVLATEQDKKLSFEKEVRADLEKKGAVEGIQKLPIKTVQFVYTNEGESYAVSGNARFIFIGKVIDVWQQKELKTLKDAMDARKIPLDKIGYSPDKLSVVEIGNNKLEKQGVIFVSPGCPYCKRLLEYINDNKEKYHFDLVITPALANSARESRRIYCATDKQKALETLITHKENDLVEDPKCDWKKVINAGMFFNTIEGRGVPLIIRKDGLKKEGIHPKKTVKEQLDSFLKRP